MADLFPQESGPPPAFALIRAAREVANVRREVKLLLTWTRPWREESPLSWRA